MLTPGVLSRLAHLNPATSGDTNDVKINSKKFNLDITHRLIQLTAEETHQWIHWQTIIHSVKSHWTDTQIDHSQKLQQSGSLLTDISFVFVVTLEVTEFLLSKRVKQQTFRHSDVTELTTSVVAWKVVWLLIHVRHKGFEARIGWRHWLMLFNNQRVMTRCHKKAC